MSGIVESASPFGRVNVNELPPRKQYQRKRHTCHPQLKYPLTPAQKKASDELRRNLTLKQDSLVFACCGAGKTEDCDGSNR